MRFHFSCGFLLSVHVAGNTMTPVTARSWLPIAVVCAAAVVVALPADRVRLGNAEVVCGYRAERNRGPEVEHC